MNSSLVFVIITLSYFILKFNNMNKIFLNINLDAFVNYDLRLSKVCFKQTFIFILNDYTKRKGEKYGL